MPETPHLSPLPSREGRGGSMRSRCFPATLKTFEARQRRDHVGKLLVTICILAVAARLIFVNQPYIDHWSWRQSHVAAIAQNFYGGGFSFALAPVGWGRDAHRHIV